MSKTKKQQVRYGELRQMLVESREEIVKEIQGKVRKVRRESEEKSHSSYHRSDFDEGSDVEFDTQEDVDIALIQMKAKTLEKINLALDRLEEGIYGLCPDCGEEISQLRLRVLPFAIRCKDCEELSENDSVKQMRVNYDIFS